MSSVYLGLADTYAPPLVTADPDGTGRAWWRRRLAPHALVVGETGSGKTVFLFSLAVSAYRAGDDLCLLDGKGADTWAAWRGREHVMYVAGETDQGKPVEVTRGLRMLHTEMTERYQRYVQARRAIIKRLRHRYQAPRPILAVLDEYPSYLAQLDKKTREEVTGLIFDIAARSREARIHLVLACQRPDVETDGGGGLSGFVRSQLRMRVLMGEADDTTRRMVAGKGVELPDVDDTILGRGMAILGRRVTQFHAHYVPDPSAPETSPSDRTAGAALLPPPSTGLLAPS